MADGAPTERGFNLRRFLLSGSGWPYLLVPFIPIAIALEFGHAGAHGDLRRRGARRDPDGGAHGQGDRGARRAHRPGHRRPAQRDVRQLPRARHRLLRTARGPAGGRQGVADRLDPRQHPARHGPRDVRGRAQPEEADVQRGGRPGAGVDAAARRRRAPHADDLPARARRLAAARRGGGRELRQRPRAHVVRGGDHPAHLLRRRAALLAEDAPAPLQRRARGGRPRRHGVAGAALRHHPRDRRRRGRPDVGDPRRLDQRGVRVDRPLELLRRPHRRRRSSATPPSTGSPSTSR